MNHTQSQQSDLFQVKKTNRYGSGVFAKKKITQGTRIHTLDGEKMTLNDLVRKVLSGNERLDDPFQIGRMTYIDLDKISRTFNHSCDPSAGIRNRSDLYALRDINVGEEITYDYSTTIAPTDWEMKCTCGAKICRGTIFDIRSIPSNQIKKYERLNALPRYIKPLLKLIRARKYKIPKYEINALKKLSKA